MYLTLEPLVERKDEYRDTVIRRGATLGANCTVVCGIEVSEFAFIGLQALLANRDVKAYALMSCRGSCAPNWVDEPSWRED